MARKPTMTKEQAGYQDGTVKEHCGNCVMFRTGPKMTPGTGSCDLVIGVIQATKKCLYWEAKPK